MAEKNIPPNNRILYFDFLRLMAVSAVVIAHTSAQEWYSVGTRTLEWQSLNFYNSMLYWCVPIFCMMSGALCLQGSYNIKKILTKNVLRFVTAYIFWSAFYAVFYLIKGDYSLLGTVTGFLEGHYHLWYLSTIAALYLLIPVLKPIAESTKASAYCIVLILIFNCILPQIRDFLALLPESLLNRVFNRFSTYISIPFSELVLYFFLGYHLHKTDISAKYTKLIYICGLVGLAATMAIPAIISYWTETTFLSMYYRYSFNTVVMSVALFLFAKRNLSFVSLSPGQFKFLKKLSTYSFGVYLIHPFFIETLDHYLHLNSLSFFPLLAVPVLSLLVMSLSFCASALIHKIPLIRKYIV